MISRDLPAFTSCSAIPVSCTNRACYLTRHSTTVLVNDLHRLVQAGQARAFHLNYQGKFDQVCRVIRADTMPTWERDIIHALPGCRWECDDLVGWQPRFCCGVTLQRLSGCWSLPPLWGAVGETRLDHEVRH